jgi:hypothetical protein
VGDAEAGSRKRFFFEKKNQKTFNPFAFGFSSQSVALVLKVLWLSS